MMKDNPDSPEVFNNVPNGEITTDAEVVKGTFVQCSHVWSNVPILYGSLSFGFNKHAVNFEMFWLNLNKHTAPFLLQFVKPFGRTSVIITAGSLQYPPFLFNFVFCLQSTTNIELYCDCIAIFNLCIFQLKTRPCLKTCRKYAIEKHYLPSSFSFPRALTIFSVFRNAVGHEMSRHLLITTCNRKQVP